MWKKLIVFVIKRKKKRTQRKTWLQCCTKLRWLIGVWKRRQSHLAQLVWLCPALMSKVDIKRRRNRSQTLFPLSCNLWTWWQMMSCCIYSYSSPTQPPNCFPVLRILLSLQSLPFHTNHILLLIVFLFSTQVNPILSLRSTWNFRY